MSLMKADKEQNISDKLIGQDDKVCTCSVRIAELLLSQATNGSDKNPLRATLNTLKKRQESSSKKEAHDK